MKPTVQDGIRFYENHPANAKPIADISTEIGGLVKSAQLATLDDVKRQLALLCRQHGGDSVVSFTYGQRSVGFFASILSRDDVRWYGKGVAANVAPEA